MCSICSGVLIHITTKHEEIQCPLRISQYCTICAKYGHTTSICPTTSNRLLEIKQSEIREFLVTHGMKTIKNTIKSNNKAIQEYADMNHMRIVYID